MATDLPDLDVHHPWPLSIDEATELALRCESAGRGMAGIKSSDGASLSSGEGVRVYGNSHGLLGSQRGSRRPPGACPCSSTRPWPAAWSAT